MHAVNHLMSGWCVANLSRLTARERVSCMVAASAADVDAVSRVVSEDAYWDWHHKAGHNLLFALVLSAVLTAFSAHRVKGFVLYLALRRERAVLTRQRRD